MTRKNCGFYRPFRRSQSAKSNTFEILIYVISYSLRFFGVRTPPCEASPAGQKHVVNLGGLPQWLPQRLKHQVVPKVRRCFFFKLQNDLHNAKQGRKKQLEQFLNYSYFQFEKRPRENTRDKLVQRVFNSRARKRLGGKEETKQSISFDSPAILNTTCQSRCRVYLNLTISEALRMLICPRVIRSRSHKANRLIRLIALDNGEKSDDDPSPVRGICEYENV